MKAQGLPFTAVTTAKMMLGGVKSHVAVETSKTGVVRPFVVDAFIGD